MIARGFLCRDGSCLTTGHSQSSARSLHPPQTGRVSLHLTYHQRCNWIDVVHIYPSPSTSETASSGAFIHGSRDRILGDEAVWCRASLMLAACSGGRWVDVVQYLVGVPLGTSGRWLAWSSSWRGPRHPRSVGWLQRRESKPRAISAQLTGTRDRS